MPLKSLRLSQLIIQVRNPPHCKPQQGRQPDRVGAAAGLPSEEASQPIHLPPKLWKFKNHSVLGVWQHKSQILYSLALIHQLISWSIKYYFGWIFAIAACGCRPGTCTGAGDLYWSRAARHCPDCRESIGGMPGVCSIVGTHPDVLLCLPRTEHKSPGLSLKHQLGKTLKQVFVRII